MLKKLNNSGYLLIEIIVSFVIAMGVAYFLAEITINLKDRQEDLDKEVGYNVDKALITKEIMDDVNKYGVDTVTINDYNIHFRYKNGIEKDLIISKENATITYGDYSKTFDESLTVGNLNIQEKNNMILIKFPATSIYSDKDYGLNLVIPTDNIEIQSIVNNDSGSNEPAPQDNNENPSQNNNENSSQNTDKKYTITIMKNSSDTYKVIYYNNGLYYSDSNYNERIASIDIPTVNGYTFNKYYKLEIGNEQISYYYDIDGVTYSNYMLINNKIKLSGKTSNGDKGTYACPNYDETECLSGMTVNETKYVSGDWDNYTLLGYSISFSEQNVINGSSLNTDSNIDSDLTLIASWK